MTLGIICAMPQELHALQSALNQNKILQKGRFTKGSLDGREVVLCLAGVGKTAAAATTATLLALYPEVDSVLCMGVAGGGEHTKIGDVVIAKQTTHHDACLKPLSDKRIYHLNQDFLESDPEMVARMQEAVETVFAQLTSVAISPKVHVGTIVSGDQFIHTEKHVEAIKRNLQDILPPDGQFDALEMEGASIAQVCTEQYPKVPVCVTRIVSDVPGTEYKAEERVSFETFVEQTAAPLALKFVRSYLQILSRANELSRR